MKLSWLGKVPSGGNAQIGATLIDALEDADGPP
jgi:hypothetical protein